MSRTKDHLCKVLDTWRSGDEQYTLRRYTDGTEGLEIPMPEANQIGYESALYWGRRSDSKRKRTVRIEKKARLKAYLDCWEVVTDD